MGSTISGSATNNTLSLVMSSQHKTTSAFIAEKEGIKRPVVASLVGRRFLFNLNLALSPMELFEVLPGFQGTWEQKENKTQLGTWDQKENKTGNTGTKGNKTGKTGTKAYFKEQGTPKSKNYF